MKFDKILDAMLHMNPPEDDTARVPPREVIAFFVRLVRGLRQLKQESLASLAGVSLTTVERVERAETVTDRCIDQIAIALGYDTGYFTTPRFPISKEAADAELAEIWGNLVPVPVRRVCTHSGIRQLGKCQGFLVHRPGVDDSFDSLISELIEWIDLASFLFGCPSVEKQQEGHWRKLYNDTLKCVRRLEQRGVNVLGGVMDAPQPGIPGWKIAVISLTPRATDPGALKRRAIFVDRRCVELRPTDDDGEQTSPRAS